MYVTARRYGGLAANMTYLETLESLAEGVPRVVENYVADNVLKPLARAISTR